MPKPPYSRRKILEYLYEQSGFTSVIDLMKTLALPKPTAYEEVNKLMEDGFLDVTIKAEDRIRRYKLKDNYRKWFKTGEQLDIDVFAVLSSI